MQIKALHKNIYSFYRYARTQECLDRYRSFYEEPVRQWQKLKAEGVLDQTCQEVTGISRATYYRHKAILERLAQGIAPPSKDLPPSFTGATSPCSREDLPPPISRWQMEAQNHDSSSSPPSKYPL